MVALNWILMRDKTQDVFVGTGANPNVYAVLVVGLGCEVVQAADVAGGN